MTRCNNGWTKLVAGGVILGSAVIAHAVGWIPLGTFRGAAIDAPRGSAAWWGLLVALGAVAAVLIAAGLRRRAAKPEP